MRTWTVGSLLVCLLSGGVSTKAQSRRTEDEQNTIDVFTRARAGVVHIKARRQASTEFGTEQYSEGTGTGFLIDEKGHVLVNFGVPINLARRVVPDLIAMGHPYRPSLGIDGVEITPEIADLFGIPRRRGFLVERVEPWSLAERAGIRAGSRIVLLNESAYVLGGDVVTAIDGEEVSSAGQIARILLYARPGQTLALSLLRDGSLEEIAIPLGPMHGR